MDIEAIIQIIIEGNRRVEKELNVKGLTEAKTDPQLAGGVGAALFAYAMAQKAKGMAARYPQPRPLANQAPPAGAAGAAQVARAV